jgi:hypothetical protein
MSQNQYFIPALSRKPTTNHLPYTLAEIKHTVYYAFTIINLVYSEILNVLYAIAIYAKKYIYLEIKL